MVKVDKAVSVPRTVLRVPKFIAVALTRQATTMFALVFSVVDCVAANPALAANWVAATKEITYKNILSFITDRPRTCDIPNIQSLTRFGYFW